MVAKPEPLKNIYFVFQLIVILLAYQICLNKILIHDMTLFLGYALEQML